MANISINGVAYTDVPRIDVPNTVGVGNSSFYETSGDTATAADIAYGKTAHGANGLITGEAVPSVPTLQNKTVTPNRYDQQITADNGYDGLGTVTITKDKGVQMQYESSGAGDTPTLLDFSNNTDMSTFIGWSRYFHSTSDDTSTARGNSAWGAVKTCKIKLPSTTTKIQTRCFAGMTGLVEVDGSEVTGDVTVNSRAFFAVPLLATIGSLWSKIKSVTQNSFRPLSGGNNVSNFEHGQDIVASNLDTIVSDGGSDGYCFNRCGFKSFTAPKLPYVSQYMFAMCKNMQKADFTAVTKINEYAFSNCTSLKDLYLRYNGVVTLSNTNAFPTTILSNLKIHVPQGKKSAYEADTNWAYLVSQGATIVEIS